MVGFQSKLTSESSRAETQGLIPNGDRRLTLKWLWKRWVWGLQPDMLLYRFAEGWGHVQQNALACDFIIVRTSQRVGTQSKPAMVSRGSTVNMQVFFRYAGSSCLSLLCWVWFSSFLEITRIHLPVLPLPYLSRENSFQDSEGGSLRCSKALDS